jgi:signal transduction histidine kinase
MLEAARIESNALYLAREQVDLPSLLEEIRAEFSAILQDRNLSMVLANVPARLALTGDAYHLKRAFSRLIENAIKFTPAGGIEVRVALREFTEIFSQKPELNRFSPTFFQSRPEGSLLQVTIRDTGIGIPPEEQVRVFDKFYEIGEITAHSSSRTRFGGKGVGLGLTLVKGMVEAHGGMVWVESSCQGEGDGSAFHVLLPLAPKQKEAHG